MITREEATIMGINAPLSHQRVIAKLMYEFGRLYFQEKTLRLEPLPETMIDQDQTSPAPDIMLYDSDSEEKPVIIEITRTGSVKNDMDKVRQLITQTNFGIVEGFVYDYKKNEWHKYKKDVGDVLDKPSFCDTINLDLATLI